MRLFDNPVNDKDLVQDWGLSSKLKFAVAVFAPEVRSEVRELLSNIGDQAFVSGHPAGKAIENSAKIARRYGNPVRALEIIKDQYGLALQNRVNGGFEISTGDLLWLNLEHLRLRRERGVVPGYVELSGLMSDRQTAYVSADLKRDAGLEVGFSRPRFESLPDRQMLAFRKMSRDPSNR